MHLFFVYYFHIFFLNKAGRVRRKINIDFSNLKNLLHHFYISITFKYLRSEKKTLRCKRPSYFSPQHMSNGVT